MTSINVKIVARCQMLQSNSRDIKGMLYCVSSYAQPY